MPKCAYCKKSIFGGKKQDELRFCNDVCYEKGFLVPMAEQASPEAIAEMTAEIHQQPCPICGGEGPVDISTSHTAWSLIFFTSWKDHPKLSCRSCGKRSIYNGIIFTSFCGWWGFPFGFFVTPWQIMNGIKSLRKLPHSSRPSEQLQEMVKLDIAASLLHEASIQDNQ